MNREVIKFLIGMMSIFILSRNVLKVFISD